MYNIDYKYNGVESTLRVGRAVVYTHVLSLRRRR